MSVRLLARQRALKGVERVLTLEHPANTHPVAAVIAPQLRRWQARTEC